MSRVMSRNVSRRRNLVGEIILKGIIFLVFIMGAFKCVELVIDVFFKPPITTRQVSVIEAKEMIGKNEESFVASGYIDYHSSYMDDFKSLDLPINYEEQKFLYALSKDYNISYPFVLGLIECESSFDKNVISKTRDYGLMQINEINHNWLRDNLKVDDMLEPYNNIRGGMYILSKLFEKYGSEDKVLMAYNMGEAGAKKLWSKGVRRTNYSDKVFKAKKKYEEILK